MLPGRADGVWLWWRGRLHRWSAAGYEETRQVRAPETVALITPPSTVNALAAGYVPSVQITRTG